MQSKTDINDCPGFVFRQDGTNELSAHVFRALNKITSVIDKVKKKNQLIKIFVRAIWSPVSAT